MLDAKEIDRRYDIEADTINEARELLASEIVGLDVVSQEYTVSYQDEAPNIYHFIVTSSEHTGMQAKIVSGRDL